MTRIIAGTAGGRRIKTPAGDGTRPTSDRVREALFSAIDSELGSIAGLRFLDVYAGSGAVGLEARSRGAGVVTLVEHDRRAAALIRENARTLGFTGIDVVVAPVAARATASRSLPPCASTAAATAPSTSGASATIAVVGSPSDSTASSAVICALPKS